MKNGGSEEDPVDAKTFLKKFNKKGNIDWLDVGAGPGTKPIRILQEGLEERCNIRLDVLEPENSWMNLLTKNFKEASLGYNIRNKYLTTWEDFNENKKYDVITFFHSAYGIDTKSLEKIPKFLKEEGCGCIVAENPESDLHKIKKHMFPYIHNQELASSSKEIIDLLDDKGIKYEVSGEEPQKFCVDKLLDEKNPDRYIPLSFILQTKPEDQDKVFSKEVKEELAKALSKYVKKDEKSNHYINTPDKFIWVYK